MCEMEFDKYHVHMLVPCRKRKYSLWIKDTREMFTEGGLSWNLREKTLNRKIFSVPEEDHVQSVEMGLCLPCVGDVDRTVKLRKSFCIKEQLVESN